MNSNPTTDPAGTYTAAEVVEIANACMAATAMACTPLPQEMGPMIAHGRCLALGNALMLGTRLPPAAFWRPGGVQAEPPPNVLTFVRPTPPKLMPPFPISPEEID
ncbi:MAG: hypothetical protein ABIT01_08005 [Thermoanaerobaculia bacterium]